jgi:phosphatidate cytidylyltransferase
MIGRVLWICFAAFLIGGAGLYGASRKVDSSVRRSRLIKFVTYFAIVYAVLLGAMAGNPILSAMMLVVVALGAHELYGVLPRASGGRLNVAWGMGAVYLLIAAGAVAFAWRSRPAVAVFVFLVVCAFDGFSQVTGQMLGRHRLAPKISPGKTIEGSIGGLLFAAGMALVLQPVVGWSVLRCLALCCFIAAIGLAGDLVASQVKRKGGVKDFGNLIPGHGGILDRFDSFMFASAACVVADVVAGWWSKRLFG